MVDNASSDHTAEVLQARTDLPLRIIRNEENLGGAGGFHLGVGMAYDAGFDRIWLMDDDVVPAPECLQVLLDHPGPGADGRARGHRGTARGEGGARASTWPTRSRSGPSAPRSTTGGTSASEMPAEVVLENVAFEGFMVHRRVIDAIGLPDPSYFIFYDDCDFAIRARRAGFTLVGVRDAVLVRQLDFDQQHALDTWKGFYMYRNLFAVHFRYGENVLVRLKPYLIVLGVVRTVTVSRGSRRGAQRDPCHSRRAWHAPRPTPWRALEAPTRR